MKSTLRGHLLIASPRLNDANFFRSVVLVVQHDEEGAFGLILNRPGPSCFGELWTQVGDGPCPAEQAIHIGGPVEGPLMALHAHPRFDDNRVVSGVFFSALGREELRTLMQGDHPFRIYSGYAGWGKSQLDQELKVGGWLVLPASCDDVFYDQQAVDLWNQSRCRVGEGILSQSLDLTRAPENPELN